MEKNKTEYCNNSQVNIVPVGNMSAEDRAEAYFKKGFNCSQAVFAAFADRYGIDEQLALRLSASFGGGLGRMREVCGCVSGMAMVAGLETGSYSEDDAEGKGKNYEVMQHLADEYKKISGGSIICAELLGLKPVAANEETQSEMRGAKPSERTEQYYKKRPCVQLVRDACTIIEREFFGGRENE